MKCWTDSSVNPALSLFLSLETLICLQLLTVIMKAQSLPCSNYILLLFSLISSLSMSFDKSPTSPSATSRLVSPLSPKSPPSQSPRAESPRSPTHSGSMSPTANGDAEVRLCTIHTNSTAVLFSIVSLQKELWRYHGTTAVFP